MNSLPNLDGWIWLAVLAMAFNVAKVLAVKTLCRNTNPSVLIFYARLLPAVLLIVPAALSDYRIHDPETFWGATLLAAVLTLIASLLYVRSMQWGELALVAPIQASVPAFMILTTFVLYGEAPKPLALLLIVAIMGSVGYVLLRSFRRRGVGRQGRWLLPALMSFLAAAAYGVSTVADRLALSATTNGVLLYVACWHLVTLALLGFYLLRNHRHVLAQGRSQLTGISVYVLVATGAFLAQQFAVEASIDIDNGVTFVKTIVMLHIGIAALAGVLILKEKPAADLLVANAIALVCGMALLAAI